MGIKNITINIRVFFFEIINSKVIADIRTVNEFWPAPINKQNIIVNIQYRYLLIIDLISKITKIINPVIKTNIPPWKPPKIPIGRNKVIPIKDL